MRSSEFCSDRGVPISLHHDSSSPARPAEHEYVASLENALRRHRSTSLAWCHAGISRRIEPAAQIGMLVELLHRHPNLTVELSWVLLDHIVDDSAANPDWVELGEAFPDQFIVGSDTIARGRRFAGAHNQILTLGQALSTPTRERVLRENTQALWFLRPPSSRTQR